MQQQFFKPMQAKHLAPRPNQLYAARGHPGPIIKTQPHRYIDVKITEGEADSLRAKLPPGFFLLSLSPHDFPRTGPSNQPGQFKHEPPRSKAELIQDKRADKKIQQQDRAKLGQHPRKYKTKQNLKLSEGERKEKVRKNFIGKDRPSDRPAEDKLALHKSMQNQGEYSDEFLVNQPTQTLKNPQKTVQNNTQAYQKQKMREYQNKQAKKIKQFQKQGPLKQKSILNENLYYENMNNLNMIPGEPHFDYFGHKNSSLNEIPRLTSGLPRYSPPPVQNQLSGTPAINTLRYILGISYGQPLQQPVAKLNEKQKNFCLNIYSKLRSHRSSQAFRVAVDPERQGAPNYHYVVYNPMDLETIHKKILKQKYHNVTQFHADINRIFLNSYKYNIRNSKCFLSTIEFEDYYHELMKQVSEKPEEYVKQWPKITKNKKADNFDELDFTEQTPIKKRKKNSEANKQGPHDQLAKSQVVQTVNLKKSINMGAKKRQNYDEQSLANSVVGDINMSLNHQAYLPNSSDNFQSITKNSKKQEPKPKLKRVKSNYEHFNLSQPEAISHNYDPPHHKPSKHSNQDDEDFQLNYPVIVGQYKKTRNKRKQRTEDMEKQSNKQGGQGVIYYSQTDQRIQAEYGYYPGYMPPPHEYPQAHPYPKGMYHSQYPGRPYYGPSLMYNPPMHYGSLHQKYPPAATGKGPLVDMRQQYLIGNEQGKIVQRNDNYNDGDSSAEDLQIKPEENLGLGEEQFPPMAMQMDNKGLGAQAIPRNEMPGGQKPMSGMYFDPYAPSMYYAQSGMPGPYSRYEAGRWTEQQRKQKIDEQNSKLMEFCPTFARSKTEKIIETKAQAIMEKGQKMVKLNSHETFKDHIFKGKFTKQEQSVTINNINSHAPPSGFEQPTITSQGHPGRPPKHKKAIAKQPGAKKARGRRDSEYKGSQDESYMENQKKVKNRQLKIRRTKVKKSQSVSNESSQPKSRVQKGVKKPSSESQNGQNAGPAGVRTNQAGQTGSEALNVEQAKIPSANPITPDTTQHVLGGRTHQPEQNPVDYSIYENKIFIEKEKDQEAPPVVGDDDDLNAFLDI